MKKFWFTILLALFAYYPAYAVNMVQVQSYLDIPIRIVGIPDFPPFAYYEDIGTGIYKFHSIFYDAVINALQKHNVETEPLRVRDEDIKDVRLLLVKAKSGDAEMFIGAYADTKLFSGLDVIYPAVISNPIHVITLKDTNKIKNMSDLKNLQGIVCKSEYFSDFVLRKLKELGVNYVDTPYEAYEAIITGKADYMLGSLYYNRIMASRFGVEDYLTYSKNPIWNIPFFIALSKVMPVLSEYKKVLKTEFEKPEFAETVKQNILEEVNNEVYKNTGVVPPSFVSEIEQPQEVEEREETEEEISSGHIVKQEIHQKTVDEVLDGI